MKLATSHNMLSQISSEAVPHEQQLQTHQRPPGDDLHQTESVRRITKCFINYKAACDHDESVQQKAGKGGNPHAKLMAEQNAIPRPSARKIE
jgi:hypothetical protein